MHVLGRQLQTVTLTFFWRFLTISRSFKLQTAAWQTRSTKEYFFHLFDGWFCYVLIDSLSKHWFAEFNWDVRCQTSFLPGRSDEHTQGGVKVKSQNHWAAAERRGRGHNGRKRAADIAMASVTRRWPGVRGSQTVSQQFTYAAKITFQINFQAPNELNPITQYNIRGWLCVCIRKPSVQCFTAWLLIPRGWKERAARCGGKFQERVVRTPY